MERNILEKVINNGKKIFIIIIIITIISGGIIIFLALRKEANEVIPEVKEEPSIESTPTSSEEQVITKRIEGWMVDVKGEVNNPGTYAVDDSMRLVDVIALAGGLTKNADTSITNLSKKISDQMVIIIYSKKEVSEIVARKINQSGVLECSPEEIILNGKCTTKEEIKEPTQTSKININTASKEELSTLSGIGEAKANNIIEYRNKTPFTKIEDIINVSGIGESLFEQFKECITV